MKKILLSQGKFAIVDDCDYKNVKDYNWHFSQGRAKRTGSFLHWDIIGKPEKGFVIDHINRDPLDNRRCNLRICTHRQNILNSSKSKNNTSGFVGVYWTKDREKWKAYIKINGKQIGLGRFSDVKEAAMAYNNAAIKYFGEFANLNRI